ncbi:MAG: hypothetical protein QM813_07295 [Verrucomicrobiota bacterium]
MKSTFNPINYGALAFGSLLVVVMGHAGDLAVDNLTVGSSAAGTGNATGVVPTKGVRYIIVEQLQSFTPTVRGIKLKEAYAKARDTMSPSVNNRVTVLIPPGEYDLGNSGITLDTPYIDLIGLVPVQLNKRVGGRTEAIIPSPCGLRLSGSGQGVVKQTASHVRIANMVITHTGSGANGLQWNSSDPAAYWPSSALEDVVVEHVAFEGDWTTWSSWSMRIQIEYKGVFRDCVGGGGSFGLIGIASGCFEDCYADDNGVGTSFGGYGLASGTFRNCTAMGGVSFGAGDTASGIFENCYGVGLDFGGDGGVASGKFINCVSEFGAFGGSGLLSPSAVLVHCKAGAASFGQFNTASADFSYSTSPVDLKIKIKPQGDLSMGTFNQ